MANKLIYTTSFLTYIKNIERERDVFIVLCPIPVYLMKIDQGSKKGLDLIEGIDIKKGKLVNFIQKYLAVYHQIRKNWVM